MRNLKPVSLCCIIAVQVLSCVSASLEDPLANGVRNNSQCPLWTVPSPKVSDETSATTTCKCQGYKKSTHVVLCDQRTLDISVLLFHCLTYSDAFNSTKPVVGSCLYNLHGSAPPSRNYWKLNNTNLCHFPEICGYHGNCIYYEHQTGLMCTSCEEGYAYPVYSYRIGCVECSDYKYNWLKYLAVAFLPLTVFYILVVLFRISATSGALNGYIFMCQVLTAPVSVRLFGRIGLAMSLSTSTGLFFAFIGVWNLDFFRSIYSPFCLHPGLTTLQTLMLDYVVAVYPLFLVSFTYIFVKLHNRYSLVIKLWSPFYNCFALFRKKWDIDRSLVGAFTTFLLLSYVKILNVSFYALVPNTFHDDYGNKMPRRFLYYDAKYEYFGKDHLPYALLAVFMVLTFNIIPLVLLCLYPCRCFHKVLNYFNLRCLTLHIFMDTFHGCYKLQPQDCRLFAAVYLFLRILNHSFLALAVGPSYVPMVGAMCALMIAIVALIRPYKSTWHNFADLIFFVSLSFFFIGVSSFRLVENFNEEIYHFYLDTLGAVAGLPCILYGVGLLAYLVIPKRVLLKVKNLLEDVKSAIKRKLSDTELEERLPYRFYHSDEYPPLFPKKTED